MNFPKYKPALAIVLGLSVLVSPAWACDKTASNDRISKVVASGEMQRPTRVSEGFAAEVTEKFWSGADMKQKQALAADIACSVGANTISFTRDRSVLQTYRDGKAQ
jgi:hypothetical protein